MIFVLISECGLIRELVSLRGSLGSESYLTSLCTNKSSWPGDCASTLVVAFVVFPGDRQVCWRSPLKIDQRELVVQPFCVLRVFLQTRCAMSRPPSWLRGVDEVGCLDFLQTVPWGATPEKMTEYAEWLVTNGADSLDAIAALDPASFAGSPLLALHIPVMIRTAVKAVAARDGISSSGAVAAAGGGGWQHLVRFLTLGLVDLDCHVR